MEVIESALSGDADCEKLLKYFFTALAKHEIWAEKLFDTWGIQLGNFHQTIFNQGLFTQCINTNYGKIKGKYCTATVSADSENSSNFEGFETIRIFYDLMKMKKKSTKLGVCVPDVCSSHQLEIIGNNATSKVFGWSEVSCYEPPEASNFDIFTGSLLVLLFIIPILSILASKPGRKYRKFFEAFSITKNFSSLMTVNKSDSVINCIDGMKVLSAFWIILGHRYLMSFRFNYPTMPIHYAMRHLVTKYNMGVDTFLTCSAVLVTQSLLRMIEKGTFNPIQIYVTRYFRYIPVAGVLTILFTSNIPQQCFSGAGFTALDEAHQGCRDGWFYNFFFVQNFFDGKGVCLSYMWYLACDFQLFLMTPIIVNFLSKHGMKFARVLFLSILTLCCWSFYKLFVCQLPHFPQHYMLPQYRASQYLIGILFGYYIHNIKQRNIEMRKIYSSLGWFTSIGLLVCHIRYHMFNTTTATLPEFIYESVYRPLWACAICWIIFACHFLKSGGVVKNVLSSHLWQPISKMSLSIYLVHYVYIKISSVSQKYVEQFEFGWQLQVYCADIVVSVLLSGIMHLLVEVPASHLINLLWTRKEKNLTDVVVYSQKKSTKE